jgi:hypothetical protein
MSMMAKSQKGNSKRGPAKQNHSLFPLLLILGGAGILLAVLLAFSNRSSPNPVAIEVTGTPRLKADKQSIEMGDVKLGTTVKASFEVANVGDQPLRFTKAPYIEVVEGC